MSKPRIAGDGITNTSSLVQTLILIIVMITKFERASRYLSIALSVLAFAVLVGCATPQNNYRPEATHISTPPINSEATAHVGDEMLTQGKFIEQEAIRLEQNIKFGMLGAYVMTPGFYVKTGEDEGSEFYVPSGGKEGGSVIKAALSDPWQSIQFYKSKNRICVVTVFNVHVCADAQGVTRTRQLSASENSFQQTLIYSGKVGNKINVGYREFSNSQARPAFNNDVEYDLSESRVIGYKGARLEVIEATNEFIRYRVLQNFNRAER